MVESLALFLKVGEIEAQNITLVPFYDYRNNDSVFLSEAAECLTDAAKEYVSICKYPENMEGVIAVYAEAILAVNMRYHGALLSGLFGVPGVDIVLDSHPHYRNKMNYVANTFSNHFPFSFSTFNVENCVEKCVDLQNNFVDPKQYEEISVLSRKCIERVANQLTLD